MWNFRTFKAICLSNSTTLALMAGLGYIHFTHVSNEENKLDDWIYVSILGRLHSVADILTNSADLDMLKACLQDDAKSPISVLKELTDKYKGRITVE